MWRYNIIFLMSLSVIASADQQEEKYQKFFIDTRNENGEIVRIPLFPEQPLSVLHPTLIEIDQANRNKLIENPKRLASQIDQLEQELQKRTVPLFWILLTFFLLILGFVIKGIASLFGKKIMTAFAPKPDRKALSALHRLKKLNLPQKERFVDFYSRTTLILRKFLEDQYKLKVMALTTQEFLDQLVLHPIFQKEMQQRLQQFLQHADLVKFAHHVPTIQECEEMQQSAREFIEDCSKF